MSTVLHCCISVRGALKWPKSRLRRFLRHESGRWATADEAQDFLLDELQQGHLVLPIGEPCEGFDYVKGCPGHEGGEGAEGP